MRFHGPTIARGEGESVRVHSRLAVIGPTRSSRCHYFGDGCFEASSFAVELPCLRPVTLRLDWSALCGSRCLWQSVPLQMNLAGRVCQTVATGRLLGCLVPLHQETASFGSAVDQGSGLQNEHARVIGARTEERAYNRRRRPGPSIRCDAYRFPLALPNWMHAAPPPIS
jgi:hypothetical protein